MKKLFENWKRYINEGHDWYSDEYETMADRKFAERPGGPMDPAMAQKDHGEGSMAQGQLKRISELATMISQEFDDSTDLEEWVESKLTKALDYLSSVQNYMRGKADEKAAEEILSTRMGSYSGVTLPGGKKIK
tara:strand:+ start:300 stop:698 length:399 start_codon:yes stop_codon:yes gene_type:complete